MKRIIICFALIFASLFTFCACSKSPESDSNITYTNEITMTYNEKLMSTTLSNSMSPSRPIYFGISITINNDTKDSKKYDVSDFYFKFTQKTTSGEIQDYTYIAKYGHYSYPNTSESFTINSKELKNVALWSGNACYLNGTGHYSIPSLVQLYYAGTLIGSFVPVYK